MPSRWDRVKSALWVVILMALVGGLAYSLRPPPPLGREINLTAAGRARQPLALVPPLGQTPSPAPPATPTPSATADRAVSTPGPTPARTTAARRPSPSPTLGERININTASASELDRLPGIGPALAERIIQYRQANGPFQRLEDLKKVSGIGDKIFEGLKDLTRIE